MATVQAENLQAPTSGKTSPRHSLQKLFRFACILGVLSPHGAGAQTSETGKASPGFYIGAESGLNWLMSNNGNSYHTGYAIGGVAGYDFLGPRLELEVVYRSNGGTGPAPFGTSVGQINQLATMVNALYDFRPGATITPYAGAGLGVSFADAALTTPCSLCSTDLAYQAIVGIGYNANSAVRINLDARYFGTTNPGTYVNNDLSVMLGVTYKLGQHF